VHVAFVIHDNSVCTKGPRTTVKQSEDKHEKKPNVAQVKLLCVFISCTTVVCFVYRTYSYNSVFFYVVIVGYHLYAGYLQSYT